MALWLVEIGLWGGDKNEDFFIWRLRYAKSSITGNNDNTLVDLSLDVIREE